MFERKIDNDELWEFIKAFAQKYNNITPGTGFLAGYFKVSIQCIVQKLRMFERKGLIKRERKAQNKVTYTILNNN